MDPKIVEEVKKRFAEIMKLEMGTIDMEASLRDVYGLDSLNALRLISELEVGLGVDIPEDDLMDMQTLSDVVSTCEKYADEKSSP